MKERYYERHTNFSGLLWHPFYGTTRLSLQAAIAITRITIIVNGAIGSNTKTNKRKAIIPTANR